MKYMKIKALIVALIIYIPLNLFGATSLLYTFDGNALDTSGSGCNGTATSVTYGTGHTGTASTSVVTTGTGSYVTVSCAALPVGTNSRTVNYWIKYTGASGDGSFGWGTNANGKAFSQIPQSGVVYFGGYNVDLTGFTTINDGNWHMITLTYNGSTLKIYVDSVLDNSGNLTLNTTGTTLYIGCRWDGSSCMAQSVDNFQVDDAVWTQDEITTAYTGVTTSTTTTATSTVIIGNSGTYTFGIAIIVALLSMIFISLIYNRITSKKKIWQK